MQQMCFRAVQLELWDDVILYPNTSFIKTRQMEGAGHGIGALPLIRRGRVRAIPVPRPIGEQAARAGVKRREEASPTHAVDCEMIRSQVEAKQSLGGKVAPSGVRIRFCLILETSDSEPHGRRRANDKCLRAQISIAS